MYVDFYGLTGDPFQMSPSSAPSFDHGGFNKAKSYLLYALQRGDGMVLITGPTGCGKTTLIRQIKRELNGQHNLFCDITCSRMDANQFLRMVAYRLGLNPSDLGKADLVEQIRQTAVSLLSKGRQLVLTIDEVQCLEDSALDEIKNIANHLHADKALIKIVLVGQSAFKEKLKEFEHQQLLQRVTAAGEVTAIALEDCVGYVRHCLTSNGWVGRPSVTYAAVGLVHGVSQGLPRKINLIFSRLMLRGMVEQLEILAEEDARLVVNDLYEEGLLNFREIEGVDLADYNGVSTEAPSDESGESVDTDVTAEHASENFTDTQSNQTLPNA